MNIMIPDAHVAVSEHTLIVSQPDEPLFAMRIRQEVREECECKVPLINWWRKKPFYKASHQNDGKEGEAYDRQQSKCDYL
jgi:hypothetical protein